MYVFADVYPCTVSQSQADSETCPAISISLAQTQYCIYTFPIRVRYCPAPILTILIRSRPTCGLDLTMSPTYICLTAHWIAPDGHLQHDVLDVFLCTNRHTRENMV